MVGKKKAPKTKPAPKPKTPKIKKEILVRESVESDLQFMAMGPGNRARFEVVNSGGGKMALNLERMVIEFPGMDIDEFNRNRANLQIQAKMSVAVAIDSIHKTE
jgi:hypothetical protein